MSNNGIAFNYKLTDNFAGLIKLRQALKMASASQIFSTAKPAPGPSDSSELEQSKTAAVLPENKSISQPKPIMASGKSRGRKRLRCEPDVFGKEARGLSVQAHGVLKKILQSEKGGDYPVPSSKEKEKLTAIVMDRFKGKRPAECLKLLDNESDLLEYMCKLYEFLEKQAKNGEFSHVTKERTEFYIERYRQLVEKMKERLAEHKKAEGGAHTIKKKG